MTIRKGKLHKSNEDFWFVIDTYAKEKSMIPIHPDDENEFSHSFEEGQKVEYEIVDLYEGEKIPWHFAKLIL